MNNQYRLSDVAKDYLAEFERILEKMMEKMTQAQLTDSISNNFIVQMIPHHQAAIEMSRNILRYTTNVPLQEIASGIVSEQTKSIENMLTIQCKCGSVINPKQELCRFQKRMDQIMQGMFSNMGDVSAGNRLDCNFMREMIPHHQGAVEMSETTLRYNICPELRPILEAIILSQKRGICRMKSLLHCLKC